MTFHSLKCHGYFVAYSLAECLNPWQPWACDKAEAFTLRHPVAVKGLTLSLPSAPCPSQLELGCIRGALFMCFGSVSGSLIAEISWLLVPIWRVPCCFLSTWWICMPAIVAHLPLQHWWRNCLTLAEARWLAEFVWFTALRLAGAALRACGY